MTSYEERIGTVPADPDKAANYQELLALWDQQRQSADPSPAELAEWDKQVLALLSDAEQAYYLDETKLAGGTTARGKVNRLTGILLGRHGMGS